MTDPSPSSAAVPETPPLPEVPGRILRLARLLAEQDPRGVLSEADVLADNARDMAAITAAFPGSDYIEVLDWLHAVLRPATYLEIGVETGRSLCLVQPGTRAVGVDPNPQLDHAVPDGAVVERITSNAFFRDGPADRHFGGSGIDLAFIDGLHHAEQVVQDFVYTVPRMTDGGVIVLHDVLPVRDGIATRERRTVFWTGDVWKAGLAIRDCYPGLDAAVVRAAPSGMMLIKVGNAASRVQHGSLKDRLLATETRPFDDDARAGIEAIGVVANTREAITAFLGQG